MRKETTIKNIDPRQLDRLFQSIGWTKRGKNKWKKVLSKSSFVYSVWDNNKLIGFGRIVEDGVMCMFYDICVNPKYQGQGIGIQIMKKLVKQVKNKKYTSIGLFVWEKNIKAIPFYKKFGFKRVKTGMELTKYMKRD